MPLLEADMLTKSYHGPHGNVPALEGVSFAVERGEFVAVRGPSGCGKTTLMLILGTMLKPDGGHVRIAEQDPYALSAAGRRQFRAKEIGFVFQEFHLVPYLSVLENVMAPALALPRNGAHDRANELLLDLGLSDRADHKPHALSTGERQRVALARALFHDPPLILADEPTGNLDHDNAKRVIEHLHRRAADGGAVLMVTHQADAAGEAHRSIELEKGRLVEAAAAG